MSKNAPNLSLFDVYPLLLHGDINHSLESHCTLYYKYNIRIIIKRGRFTLSENENCQVCNDCSTLLHKICDWVKFTVIRLKLLPELENKYHLF